MSAWRPVFDSKSASAVDAGVVVNTPGATPHQEPHSGTSFCDTGQLPGPVDGVGPGSGDPSVSSASRSAGPASAATTSTAVVAAATTYQRSFDTLPLAILDICVVIPATTAQDPEKLWAGVNRPRAPVAAVEHRAADRDLHAGRRPAGERHLVERAVDPADVEGVVNDEQGTRHVPEARGRGDETLRGDRAARRGEPAPVQRARPGLRVVEPAPVEAHPGDARQLGAVEVRVGSGVRAALAVGHVVPVRRHPVGVVVRVQRRRRTPGGAVERTAVELAVAEAVVHRTADPEAAPGRTPVGAAGLDGLAR